MAIMAGLGLFFHKSALALVPRGLLQSAYDFFELNLRVKSQGIVVESPRAVLPTPGATRKKSFLDPQGRLW
jgi:hypothetical protein